MSPRKRDKSVSLAAKASPRIADNDTDTVRGAVGGKTSKPTIVFETEKAARGSLAGLPSLFPPVVSSIKTPRHFGGMHPWTPGTAPVTTPGSLPRKEFKAR